MRRAIFVITICVAIYLLTFTVSGCGTKATDTNPILTNTGATSVTNTGTGTGTGTATSTGTDTGTGTGTGTGSGTGTGTILDPPDAATGPDPADGSVAVALTTGLSWNSANRATGYYVFFGTASPPAYHGQTASTSGYSPGSLSYETTYYWKVVPFNSSGNASGCVEWTFATEGEPISPPSQVTSGTPANGTDGVSIETDLSWAAATGATAYDVYFGTTNPPSLVSSNHSSTTYDPGTLEYSTIYYWRIDARNNAGMTQGGLWGFRTEVQAPEEPLNPLPADDSADVDPATSLSWDAAERADGYYVHFGTSSSPPYVGETAATTFDPGSLGNNTMYYWKVIAHNDGGNASSITWNFRTWGASPDNVDLVDGGYVYPYIEPGIVAEGDNVSLSCKAQNNGSDPSGPFIIKYYLSDNHLVDGSDYYMGFVECDGVSGDSVITVTGSVTVPSGVPIKDNYYVVGVLDGDNAVTETNESNNNFYKYGLDVVPVGSIDLTVYGNYMVLNDSEVNTGDGLRIGIYTANEGVVASGEFQVSFYLSNDTNINPDEDYFIGTGDMVSLAAGYRTYQYYNATIPSGVPMNWYYVGWVIDPLDEIGESDETNNTSLNDDKAILVNPSGSPLTMTCNTQDLDNWTGSIVYDAGYYRTDDLIEVVHGHDPRKVGFAKFDISGLPDNIIVKSFTFYYYVKSVTDSFSSLRVYVMSYDPETTNPGSLYYNGEQISPPYQSVSSTGQKSSEFSGLGCLRLQQSLSSGWFALKFYGC